ncbi:MAG: zinc ribbon domain-containing protein [Acidobacteriaceae bacterium]
MYCSACGQPMDPYQPYCPRCGRQTTAIPTAPPPPWTWSRVHRHVHTLGILWIAYAGWTLLQWMMVVPFLGGFFHGFGPPFHRGFDGFVFPFENMPWFIQMITVILAGRAILSLVTGYALLRRYPWARVLGIVTAFLTLIKPFTGTALAIYTLWVLLPSASGQEYEQIATP